MAKALRRESHTPNVAKPGVCWNDILQLIIWDEDGYRHGIARVTSEFMRDTLEPHRRVAAILDERLAVHG